MCVFSVGIRDYCQYGKNSHTCILFHNSIRDFISNFVIFFNIHVTKYEITFTNQ
jgi:hypothetical protein